MSNVNVSHEDARKFLEMLEGMSGNYTKLREQLEAKAYPEKIINLTPHDINLLDENNQVVKVFPCAKPHDVCTADIDTTEVREVGGSSCTLQILQQRVQSAGPGTQSVLHCEQHCGLLRR